MFIGPLDENPLCAFHAMTTHTTSNTAQAAVNAFLGVAILVLAWDCKCI